MSPHEILVALEQHLRESMRLDSDYYKSTNPSRAERKAYYERQERADTLRNLFDAKTSKPDPCQESAIITVIVPDASEKSIPVQFCRMSHELNNLLHIVVGCSEMLADHPSELQAAKFAEKIHVAAMKAARLIRTTRCRIAELDKQRPKLTQ